jgi:hypothetical protein
MDDVKRMIERVREKLLVKSFIKNTLKLGKRRGVK